MAPAGCGAPSHTGQLTGNPRPGTTWLEGWSYQLAVVRLLGSDNRAERCPLEDPVTKVLLPRQWKAASLESQVGNRKDGELGLIFKG